MAYLRVSTEIILVFVRFAHAIGAVVRGCVTSARLSLALPGHGRPQARINEELRGRDDAVFVLLDRRGSPTRTGN